MHKDIDFLSFANGLLQEAIFHLRQLKSAIISQGWGKAEGKQKVKPVS